MEISDCEVQSGGSDGFSQNALRLARVFIELRAVLPSSKELEREVERLQVEHKDSGSATGGSRADEGVRPTLLQNDFALPQFPAIMSSWLV